VLKEWLVDDGLTAVTAGELLARRGVVVPERTLYRYALEVLGRRASGIPLWSLMGELLQLDRERG
jgi:hypothetical protein